MRILFLTHASDSLTQRLYVELTAAGHDVSVEFDSNDDVTREAVALWRPDLIVAPLLKRKIPDPVWRRHRCIVLHPGIEGDRGPSALDWAIARGDKPRPLDAANPGIRGRLRPPMRQADRAIDWHADDTAAVLRKIRASDGTRLRAQRRHWG